MNLSDFHQAMLAQRKYWILNAAVPGAILGSVMADTIHSAQNKAEAKYPKHVVFVSEDEGD